MGHFALDVDEDVLEVAGHRLAAVGQELARQGAAVRATPGEVSAQDWSGAARDSVCSEMSGLGGHLGLFEAHFETAAGALRSLVGDVVDAKARVRVLNQQWDQALDDHARATAIAEFGVPGPGAPRVSGEVLAGEQGRLTAAFEDVRGQLRAGSARAGGVLAGATMVAVPVGAVQAFVAGGGFPVSVGAGRALAAGQPLLARRLALDDAQAAAPLVRAAAAGDVGAVEALRERFGGRAADPLFAFELTRLVGADGLAGLAGAMAGRVFESSGDAGALRAAGDRNRWLAGFVGTALVTAADARRYAGLPADYREQVASWRDGTLFPGLIRVGRAEFTAPFAPDDPTGGDRTFYGYWAIGQFVGAGAAAGHGPGPGFMATVGADLVAWDRSLDDHACGRDAAWAAPGALGTATTTFTGERSGMAQDPVTGLLAAAVLDAEAGRALFLADVDPGPGSRTALGYLVADRMEGFSGDPYADGGDLLGRAVVTADHDRTSRPAVEVATEFVNTYMQGIIDHGPTDYTRGQTQLGAILHAIRPHLATVLAYHIDDLQTAIGAEVTMSSGTVPGPGETYDLQFAQPRQLAALFADLAADRPADLTDLTSQNPTAMQVLLRAQLLYSAQHLPKVARDGGDMPEESAMTSRTLAYMLKSGEMGLTRLGAEEDAAAERLKALLAQGVGMVPVGKIPGVGTLGGIAYDKATQYILNQSLPANAVATREYQDLALEEVLDQRVQDQVELAITQAGGWPAEHSPRQWAESSEMNYPRESWFYLPNGKIIPFDEMSPAQHHAYVQWRSDTIRGGGSAYGPALREATQNTIVGREGAQRDYLLHH